ncbi:MAG: hypothetical protein WD002_11735 [Pseudomonadales bacterium]
MMTESAAILLHIADVRPASARRLRDGADDKGSVDADQDAG